MGKRVRWGILGLGSIARSFATGLRALPEAELLAVGSRTAEKAAAFGDEFGAPHRHGSYADLANDPDVDAIYIATPHSFHKENSLLCLEAGKAVLCEKPFTINAREAEEVIRTARDRQVFLMEAMWSRFLPVMVKVRQWLADGAIGEVRMLHASFAFRAGWDPEGRLLNPELGGGGLLDIGVYTVSLAFMVFGGAPARITTQAHLGDTGVDEQAAITFGYDQGELAQLTCGIRINVPDHARIFGTEGWIEVPHFWHATQATLFAGEGDPETIEIPEQGNGYEYEAAEVAQCLEDGKLESDVMPLDETLAIMRTMDQVREQWGLKYPME